MLVKSLWIWGKIGTLNKMGLSIKSESLDVTEAWGLCFWLHTQRRSYPAGCLFRRIHLWKFYHDFTTACTAVERSLPVFTLILDFKNIKEVWEPLSVSLRSQNQVLLIQWNQLFKLQEAYFPWKSFTNNIMPKEKKKKGKFPPHSQSKKI